MTTTNLGHVHAADLSPIQFNDTYALKEPVLIVDGAAAWKVTRTWTPSYFAESYGEKLVNVSHNATGVFDYRDGASSGKVTMLRMPFRDAIQAILSAEGAKYYIQQQGIRASFAELAGDVEVPSFIPSQYTGDPNLWVGGRGSRTPLHYDRKPNFLAQVFGTKKITFFPPEDGEKLYPAVGTNYPHCSLVNFFEPDLAEFPLFAEVQNHGLELQVGPGEMLYIPPRWWHAVECLSTAISLNYWHDPVSKSAP
jgi:Cupin-like domain